MLSVELEEQVVANMGLAKLMASRFQGRVEFDDLLQVCCMSLMKVVKTFDPSKGNEFSTYACRVMQNDINTYLGRHKSQFDFEIAMEEAAFGHETVTIDDQVEASAMVGQLRKILTAEEFQVLYMASVLDMSQGEIAKAMNSRQPQICRILKRAKAKAKLSLGGGSNV